MIQLRDVSIRKWRFNSGGSGTPPNHLDVNTTGTNLGVRVGDIAIDISLNPEKQWVCTVNTAGNQTWVLRGSGGSTGPVAAIDVTYDNSTSGLTSDNVQAAIDEIIVAIVTDAININYNNSVSGLVSTNVQAAIDEVNGKITPSQMGIKYTVVDYDTLVTTYDPSTEDEHTMAVVQGNWTDTTDKYGQGAGHVFNNGLYRVESNVWVFFDHLNLQDAGEVPVNTISGTSASEVQTALEELFDMHTNETFVEVVTDVIADGSTNQLRKNTIEVRVLNTQNAQTDVLIDQGIVLP